jgi:hypothetical protein
MILFTLQPSYAMPNFLILCDNQFKWCNHFLVKSLQTIMGLKLCAKTRHMGSVILQEIGNHGKEAIGSKHMYDISQS